MIDNRIVINNHLKRTRGGKISFTHLLGYAIVEAVKKFPNMNRHYAVIDGKLWLSNSSTLIKRRIRAYAKCEDYARGVHPFFADLDPAGLQGAMHIDL